MKIPRNPPVASGNADWHKRHVHCQVPNPVMAFKHRAECFTIFRNQWYVGTVLPPVLKLWPYVTDELASVFPRNLHWILVELVVTESTAGSFYADLGISI